MRVYGTSPLYNYVELIFRCKRMFIAAILLGTIITSLMVYMRSDMYSASMLAELSGDPKIVGAPGRDEESPAVRKATFLQVWMREDPDFIPGVLKRRGFDLKHPKDFTQFSKRVAQSIGGPELINGRYMKLTITWPDKEEAVQILQDLYGTFANRIVNLETAATTTRAQNLQQQWQAMEKQADEKAAARVKYLTEHYWQQPTLLGSTMGSREAIENQIAETKLEATDARSRLAKIATMLQNTPEMIKEGDRHVDITTDPTLDQANKLKDAEAELKRLKQTYSDLHPKVRDKQREIDALKQQIVEVRKQPAQVTTKQVETTTHTNPRYETLKQMQTQYEVASNALDRKVQDLTSNLSREDARLQQMPGEEVRFKRIDRDYAIFDTMRNSLYSKWQAAKIEADMDKITKQQEVKIEVPPAAEKLDSSGKTILLYGLGPFLGIVIAFCFSLIAETLDHSLRTPVEVEKYLNKPVLAVIPKMESPRKGRKQLAGSSNPSITS